MHTRERRRTLTCRWISALYQILLLLLLLSLTFSHHGFISYHIASILCLLLRTECLWKLFFFQLRDDNLRAVSMCCCSPDISSIRGWYLTFIAIFLTLLSWLCYLGTVQYDYQCVALDVYKQIWSETISQFRGENLSYQWPTWDRLCAMFPIFLMRLIRM